MPWWNYALAHGFEHLLGELGGGAIAGVEGLPFWQQLSQHLVSLLLLGSTVIFGMRPPWGIEWLGLPLLPVILFFWMAVLLNTGRKMVKGNLSAEKWLLSGVCVVLVGGFVFSPFGADPSGRYFLPLTVPLMLFASDLVVKVRARFGGWSWSLACVVIFYHIWGTLQCVSVLPPGITTQFNPVTQVDQSYLPELIEFLSEQGEMRGHTNYWVAYPLAFLSDERLVFTPDLPYHRDFRYTPRDNRYPAYNEIVAESPRTAWITTNHPELDAYLRDQFSERALEWEETKIGNFQVFYNLSKRVSAAELGLGIAAP